MAGSQGRLRNRGRGRVGMMGRDIWGLKMLWGKMFEVVMGKSVYVCFSVCLLLIV